MKKLILPTFIAMAISAVASYYLFRWMAEFSIDPKIKNTIDNTQIVKLVVINLVYFLALITLPFLATELIRWFRISANGLWKTVMALEALSLIFAIISTPPDLISTLLLFFLCQLIVLVNGIAIGRKLKEQGKINQL